MIFCVFVNSILLKNVMPRDASFVSELSIIHNWTKHKPRRELSRRDYDQRRVILDHIRSLLAGPDRSGLVAPAANDYAEKDLICEFITRWYLTNLRLS